MSTPRWPSPSTRLPASWPPRAYTTLWDATRQQRRPSRCGTCGRCSACRRWTEQEDAFVDALLGECELSEIVTRLQQRYGIERSVPGLVSRLKRRARSRWSADLSLRDVERLFGIDHRVILRWWVKPGLLVGRRWSGRGPHAGWLFSGETVERFVRDHRHAYEPARMAPGHPLTNLAKLVNRSDPWLGRKDLACYLGVCVRRVSDWIALGLVPHKRRFGAGARGQIRILASDFPKIAAELGAQRALPTRPQSHAGGPESDVGWVHPVGQ
jgi:hypothetical protein